MQMDSYELETDSDKKRAYASAAAKGEHLLIEAYRFAYSGEGIWIISSRDGTVFIFWGGMHINGPYQFATQKAGFQLLLQLPVSRCW